MDFLQTQIKDKADEIRKVIRTELEHIVEPAKKRRVEADLKAYACDIINEPIIT